jgi:indole-3-glycerol phosphate synthase
MSILDTIVTHKRDEVAGRKRATPLTEILARLPGAPDVRDFAEALRDPARPSPRVIAEVKRRSPSKGVLKAGLDAVGTARVYERNGAAAISVLTDERFFGGSHDDLRAVRESVGVPVLCKEFVIDEYQVYEARLAGADALLLIVAILERQQLREYRELAASLGMASLVEVHDGAELEEALESGAGIVGINNRDLHTFSVSLDVTRALRPLIPGGVVTVSESGISARADCELMLELGVDALLVGERLVTAPDVGLATRLICGVTEAALEGSVK